MHGRKKTSVKKSDEEIAQRNLKVDNYKKVCGALMKRRAAKLFDQQSLSLTTKILQVD
jgi:hypothetical protein